MVGNALSAGLHPDALPQVCGPDTLAEISQAAMVSGPFKCHLSDQQFKRLLAEAHSASLKPDEGRYPRFRIFAGINAEDNWGDYLVAKFKNPPPLSSDELRRLAPAFPSHSHLIYVVGSGDAISLAGVLSFDYFHKHFLLDRPEFWLVGGDQLE